MVRDTKRIAILRLHTLLDAVRRKFVLVLGSVRAFSSYGLNVKRTLNCRMFVNPPLNFLRSRQANVRENFKHCKKSTQSLLAFPFSLVFVVNDAL